jgi:hypothetical protein
VHARVSIMRIGFKGGLSQVQRFGCEKKSIDLCTCESEDHEHGVGTDVNTTLSSDTL